MCKFSPKLTDIYGHAIRLSHMIVFALIDAGNNLERQEELREYIPQKLSQQLHQHIPMKNKANWREKETKKNGRGDRGHCTSGEKMF